MNVWPVIERELRTQARFGFTYLLRVLSVTALLVVALVFWANYGFTPQLGPVLFGYLNCALFVSIWVLVPLLSADCISRERREGTIGLLFLTPLRAREIVLSKGLVHGLRAMTLWLAVLPVLTIAFLLGGVTWKEAILSVLMNFSSICWALAAGLLASAFSKTWTRSILLAGGIAGCFSIALVMEVGAVEMATIANDPGFRLPFPYQFSNWQSSSNWPQMILPAGFFGATNLESWWTSLFSTLNRANQALWLQTQISTAVLAILALVMSIVVAAWNLRRSWQEEPPSAREIWFNEKFCTPIFGVKFFHRWIRKRLERNPIGWLEQRTWTGRLVTWGWFAVMISFYSAVFYVPNVHQLLSAVQKFMAWSLLTLIAVSAAGSFQRERETRVLELLLISPMNESQIINGRLRGLWGQFLPSLALMLTVWFYLAEIFRARGSFSMVPFFCAGYFTLPVIGLYYSLRRANFITSFLSTLAMGLLAPEILRILALFLFQTYLGAVYSFVKSDPAGGNVGSIAMFNHAVQNFLILPVSVVLFQIAIGLWINKKLHKNLVERSFALATPTA